MTFDIPERELQSRLGLKSTLQMRELRESLTEGTDYTRGAGGRIFYSEKGAAALTSRLAYGAPEEAVGLSMPRKPEKRATGHPAQKAAPHHAVKVVRNDLPNRRLLWCRVLDGPLAGQSVAVRVANAAHFLPGSRAGTILARPVEGAAAWEFVGNPASTNPTPRCPRFPGRW